MVFQVISSNGDVMEPHFFGNKERVNTDVYCQLLEDKVIPWMIQIAAGCKFLFQQDSAPAHTAKKTTMLLEKSVDYWLANM
jgi:hypothetical protein